MNKKVKVYPCNPTFYVHKVGFIGCSLYGRVNVMCERFRVAITITLVRICNKMFRIMALKSTFSEDKRTGDVFLTCISDSKIDFGVPVRTVSLRRV